MEEYIFPGLEPRGPDGKQKAQEFAPAQGSERDPREQLQELELIYSAAPIGLGVLSANGRFLRVNECLAEMNHRPVAEHIGKFLRDIIPDPLADYFEGVLHRVVSTGDPVLDLEVEGEMVVNSGDRRVWTERWLPQKDASGSVVAVNVVVQDITARKCAERHNEILKAELAHRLKNSMTIVQAIARQALRRASDTADAEDRLLSRLGALAAAHDALLCGEWKGVSLSKLVETQLVPFIGRRAASLVTDGPEVLLKTQEVMHLSMVLHELGSNASKYGALSASEGIVHLSWNTAGDTLSFHWREDGGPHLSGPPERKGFGTQMIESGTKRVRKTFRPTGLVCEFELSLS